MIRSSFEGWKTDWPLETHTCKTELPKAHYFFVDQLMSRAGLRKPNGQIRFTRFDKCAEIMKVGKRRLCVKTRGYCWRHAMTIRASNFR